MAFLLGKAACATPGFASGSEKQPGARKAGASPVQEPAAPVLAILDPVDLSQARSLPKPGQVLRSVAGRAGRFHVLTGLETARKLIEFDWNGGRPCHDFQCAFDAGNILMADYILYGTLTPLDGLHACTFNILDMRSGKVVHSEVGHTPRNPPEAGEALLHARLSEFASGLQPSDLRRERKTSRGVIAVVDLGDESTESRVLVERLGTRIHSIGTHDPMGQVELRELLSAMEIPLGSAAGTDSGMIDLGARLKAAYLVTSDLGRSKGGLRMDMALFDIGGKRRVRSWSSRPSVDFREILETENRTFQTLEELTGSGWTHPGEVQSDRGSGFPWVRSLLTVAGLAAAGGIGTLAYAMHEEANHAHREAEASMSSQAGRMWKQRTEEGDRGAVLLGSLAALTFGVTVTLWAF